MRASAHRRHLRQNLGTQDELIACIFLSAIAAGLILGPAIFFLVRLAK